MEEEELEKNLVEELPKPPVFYKTTTPQSTPPPIPPGDPYTVVYGGYFANTALKPPQSERTGPEFATALKEALKQAVELALRIIAVSTRDQVQTSIMAEAVKKQLAHFFQVLREYRSHEAAALLLDSLREQLRSAQQTADALERCLERVQWKMTQLQLQL